MLTLKPGQTTSKMQLTHIVVLGLAAGMTSAKHLIKVNFERYTHHDCSAQFKVGQTDHLEDPDCKNFSHYNQPFEAYKVSAYSTSSPF